MLTLANQTFSSRLLMGTGKFSSPSIMKRSVKSAKSTIVTLAMKRLSAHIEHDNSLALLRELDVTLLPNTSGAKNAQEAIFAAELAYEVLGSPWIKLEIHPDQQHLLPDPIETLRAAEVIVKKGTNQGLQTAPFLRIIIEQANVPVIVDAGIGKPSEAMAAMEMGADAVLVNTAIATASNPVAMASAFSKAVEIGRKAYEAGMPITHQEAQPSSP